jgi:LPXTG-motif cell wall-anchored protein
MTPVDRYIQSLLRNVFATQEEKETLEADMRAHFAEAQAQGEPPGQIIDEMGTPEDVAAAFNAGRDIQYAGFWQRFMAFVGDCGLLMALALPPLSIFFLLQARLPSTGEPPVGWLIVLGLVALGFLGVFVFYFPMLEAHFGKTFGKHLLRLRVVRESGAPISLGQAFVRRLSLYFEMLVPDALFIPFTDKRQRALDIIAKTVVVREPGEQAPGWGYAVCLLLPVVSLLLLLAVTLLCSPS